MPAHLRVIPEGFHRFEPWSLGGGRANARFRLGQHGNARCAVAMVMGEKNRINLGDAKRL